MPVGSPNGKKSVPDGLWEKCKKCEDIIFKKELDENLRVCPKCSHYFILSARERIKQLIDPETFNEFGMNLLPTDPFKFVDLQPYETRLAINTKKSGLQEAIIIGEARMKKLRVALGVLDFGFLGGSMGSVVGEKIALLIERAISKKLPLIIISSSGGARMQESILSLMQMAKTSSLIGYYQKQKLPYISVVAHPTSGGVTASFAMLGDIIIAEPGALVAFAGPRVIQQTIKVELPEGFQSSEFCMKHGMIDMIVKRSDLRDVLARLLQFFSLNAK
ncbi:MAG: acetyl-CoA carboxylase, carboxyltransferase subunit beta [bacterium]